MKKALALALALAFTLGLKAQTDPVVIEVGNEKIHQSEFMREFRKSMGLDPKAAPTACTYEKRQALEEYVELYANFRAKLMDAQAQRLDTLPSIRKELAQYREELKEPYLIDSATLERILREAYDRNHYALHAAHILIQVRHDALPADTLEAYQKAMEVYRKAQEGVDFGELAVEYSDDPSAKGDPNRRRAGNQGDLGCFTVFQMVYPFESAAYGLQPGEVSLPVRSDFGYHIIKLIDRVPYFGKVTLQHIWINAKSGLNGEAMIANAYERLAGGEEIRRVAADVSSDRADNASYSTDLEMNQMPPQYVVELSKLKEGEFSKPFVTPMGWHIVKLVKRETIPPYEDMMPLYKQRLSRDKRSQAPKSAFAEQCRQKYGFHDYTQERVSAKKNAPYKASLAECRAALTDSVTQKKWAFDSSMVTDYRPLFQIGHRSYNAVDLLRYIEGQQEWQRAKADLGQYLELRYRRFIDQCCLAMADSLLEEENPEFRELMEEYRNGLMIFAYNDRKVWRPSMTDTAGLSAFYAQAMPQRSIDNPDDEPYFWKSRAHVIDITVADSALLSPKKARKVVDKCLKQGFDAKALESLLARVAKTPKDSGVVAVTVKEQLIEEGASALLGKSEWRRGTYDRAQEKGYRLLVVDRLFDPTPKSVKEARGYYVSDYQSYLDQELLKRLWEKYNVKIHQNVVDEITY